MFDWEAEAYNIPAYSITDAARYLRVPVGTLRSWLDGRSSLKDDQQQFKPLIQRPSSEFPQLSFTNLVEAHVLRAIRTTHQVRLDKVRAALDYLDRQFGLSHPLARAKFQTDGVDLFIDSMGQLINVSRSGQLSMRETLKHLLARIEWDKQGIASKLFPFIEMLTEVESSKPVSIDPKVSFGRPVITGTGVPTEIVAELYDAGDSIKDIADDYGCTPSQIETAIWFESQSRAA